MPRTDAPRRGPQSPTPGQASGRPSLVPANPLPGWKALVQAALLLGIPIGLLLLAKVILKNFFPSLGY